MLKQDTFSSQISNSGTMTISGTVYKTLFLVVILIFSAAFIWLKVFSTEPLSLMPYMITGVVGGFVLALVTIFKPSWSPITAPIYCVFEGLLIGALSLMLEVQYPGIAIQAFALTIGILVALLFSYQAGLIKVTEQFRSGLIIAISGIALVYIITLGLNLFGIRIPYIHESGLIGIGFSLAVVIIASLSLLLDFDFIWQNSQNQAPKYMEWYGAFSLMVTLIWLYLEILTLLRKINGRK